MSKFKTGIEITREVNGMIFRVPGEDKDANDKKYLKLKLKEYDSKEDLYKILESKSIKFNELIFAYNTAKYNIKCSTIGNEKEMKKTLDDTKFISIDILKKELEGN